MITLTPTKELTSIEVSQLDRKELALGSWRQGDRDNALLITGTIRQERMSPRVHGEVAIAEAGFYADLYQWNESEDCIKEAAPFFEDLPLSIQGSFYHQRARVKNQQGDVDAALTDYCGAAVCWETCGDYVRQGAMLNNVAGIHRRKRQFEDAHENIERAIALTHESFYEAKAYETLAEICFDEGQLERAIVAIETALSLVGDNESWRQDFLKTRELIELKLTALAHRLQVETVRLLLIQENGNLKKTGKLLGMTHKGVAYIVDHHPELEQYRSKRKIRRKSVMKNN